MKKFLTKILAITFILSILLGTFLPMAQAAEPNQSIDENITDDPGMIPAGQTPASVEDINPTTDEPTPSGFDSNSKIDNDLGEAVFPVREVLRLDNGEQPTKYFNDEENSPLVSFVIDIIDFFTTIMGTLAVILLIVAGFMMMIANGEQQTIDKAKEIIKYAILGLVVTFLSYIIVISVQSVFIAD